MDFRGYPIFDTEPQQEVITQGVQAITETGNGLGISQTHILSPYPIWAGTYSYVIGGRPEIAALEAFFDGRRGKTYPFWVPSWAYEYRISDVHTFVPSSPDLRVEKYDSLIYDPRIRTRMPSRKIVRIQDIAGNTYYCAGITAYNNTSYANYDYLVLDVPYESHYNMAISNGIRIDFMYFVRFNQDEMALQFEARDVVTTKLTFQELPFEYPS